MVALLIPIMCKAEDYNSSCTGTHNYLATTAYDYMIRQLGVSQNTVNYSETSVVFIDKQKIEPFMADYIVKTKMKGPVMVSPEIDRKSYEETYLHGGIYVLTVKVDFKNHAGKANSFIVSNYISDEECSIGEAGLILLNREF